MFIRQGGEYRNAQPFAKVNGEWKGAAEVYARVGGTWKLVYPRDDYFWYGFFYHEANGELGSFWKGFFYNQANGTIT